MQRSGVKPLGSELCPVGASRNAELLGISAESVLKLALPFNDTC